MSKKLTKSELLQMENNVYQQQLSEKDIESVNLKKTIELLNSKIRQLESQVKLMSMDKEIEGQKSRLAQLKQQTKDYNNKLKDKYKLKGSWGINPDTGEILEEE